jgi:hypothetical protein
LVRLPPLAVILFFESFGVCILTCVAVDFF